MPQFKWPAPRSPQIASLVAVFASLGFSQCDSSVFQAAIIKVALYQKDGNWTHAARQLAGGKWSSKLGPDEDIEHDDPECLCGDSYGTIHCIMAKAVHEIPDPKA